MITPRQFEEKIAEVIENGDDNIQVILKSVGIMSETLDSLGYEAGTEVLKQYVECIKCK